MLTNTEKIATAAQDLIDNIEADSTNSLVNVKDILMIAVCDYGTTEDGEADITSLFYRCSSGAMYVQLGLLEHARNAMMANAERS